LMGVLADVTRRMLYPPPAPPGTPNPFMLADRAAFERALTTAGFKNVGIEPMTVTFSFDSLDDCMRQGRDFFPQQQRAVFEKLSSEQIEHFFEEVRTGYSRFVDSAGHVAIPCEAIVASAVK